MTTESNDRNEQGALTNAEQIIERFGGIRPMASKMAVPVTTVQGWKKRNVIPENRRDDVLRAARMNDIDLSDLIGKGSANENARGDDEAGGFDRAVSAATRGTDGAAEERHRAAVAAGAASVPPSSSASSSSSSLPRSRTSGETPSEDLIFGRLKATERRAVQKSALISVVLVAAAAGFSVFLLWPSSQGPAQPSDHGRRIGALEKQVGEVKQEQTSLRRLIPGDLEEKYAQLQEQARNLQGQVVEASRHAGAIAESMTAPGATMPQRMAALEQGINQLRDLPALTAMLEKFKGLQQTPEGQRQLTGSMAALTALVRDVQGQEAPEALDEALAQAQQQDDALGRTLQGVPQQDLKAAALLLGLAQFRTSLNRNAPFAEDLALLHKLVGDQDPGLNAALDRLAPQAEKGVLTPQGLSQELRGLTGDIVVASLKGDDVTLKEKAMARLNEVLQVQKDGQLVTGTDTQARIARAQTLLEAGDVQAALTELKALEGPAAETAAPVIGQAEATLLAQTVQNMLAGRVLTGIEQDMSAAGAPAAQGGMRRLIGALDSIGGPHIVGAPGSDFVILPSGAKAPGFAPSR